MTKRISDTWRGAYSDKLEKSEKREVARFKKYLKSQYNEGVDSFLATSSEGGFASLFKLNDLKDLYVDLYTNIGTDFAVWYQKNYENYITKNTTNPDTWSTEFERYGQNQAGEKIVIVQGSAKKELRKNIKNLFKDEEFQRLGRLEQGRILKNRFNDISNYQALRIVRTEATSAANEGIMRSATDLFPKGVLMKEWVSGTDTRVRRIANKDKADHAVMNNHPAIPYDELFQVPTVRGVERMSRPADSTHGASAYNIINCRCSVAVYPIEGADVREGVVLDGIGGDFSAATTRLIGDEIVTARKPIREVAEDVVQAPLEAKTIKEAKEIFTNKFKEAGVNVQKVMMGRGIDIKDINKMIVKFHELADKYNISELRNGSNITLKFTGGKGYAGQVRYYTSGRRFDNQGNITDLGYYGKIADIDFGRGYNARPDGYKKSSFARSRTKDVDDRAFSKRGKSVSDSENWEVTTMSHEFAHYIDVWETSTLKNSFWKEIKDLQKEYNNELRKYAAENNAKKYNEIFLGDYANTKRDEFFAEAFAEFETTNKPSKYALLVGQLTLKYFGK
jgi:hypothetical protein